MPLPRALVPAVLALFTALPGCTVDLPDEGARTPAPAPEAASPRGATIVVVPGDAPDPGGAVPAAVLPGLPAGGFTAVSAEGVVDVDVTVGAAGPARIACSAKLASKVHVEGQGETIHVWTERGFHNRRGRACTVFVSLASLRSLDASGPGNAQVHGRADGLAAVRASGPGNVEIEDLTADAMRIDLSGPGNVTVERLRARSVAIDTSGPGALRLSGTSERVKIESSGPGEVDVHDLAALDLEVNASGPGSVEANASRRAIVNSTALGSVTVGGRPVERRARQQGMGAVSFE